jgi:GGDEF domain-containing protein
MFSLKKGSDETENPLAGVVQQLLDGCASHAVNFDADEQNEFRDSLRNLAERLYKAADQRSLIVFTNEINKALQAHNKSAEKFIAEVLVEKQLTVELLCQSLLRVCNVNDEWAQSLRQIQKDLAKASQLQEMRALRSKLTACVGSICLEAEQQNVQHRENRERADESNNALVPRDQVTGLPTLKSAEARIREVSAIGHKGYVTAFFLKNVDVVNRRFGFSAGDDVLKRFAAYLKTAGLQTRDQLFRWRGPCFLLITDRFATLEAIQATAQRLGTRGPEVVVESEGKSMVTRLMAVTAVFPIPKGEDLSELSAKIDQFASEQFKLSPAAGGGVMVPG